MLEGAPSILCCKKSLISVCLGSPKKTQAVAAGVRDAKGGIAWKCLDAAVHSGGGGGGVARQNEELCLLHAIAWGLFWGGGTGDLVAPGSPFPCLWHGSDGGKMGDKACQGNCTPWQEQQTDSGHMLDQQILHGVRRRDGCVGRGR